MENSVNKKTSRHNFVERSSGFWLGRMMLHTADVHDAKKDTDNIGFHGFITDKDDISSTLAEIDLNVAIMFARLGLHDSGRNFHVDIIIPDWDDV